MLYKNFNGSGFNLLSTEFEILKQNLNYVHLTDVTFNFYPDRKEVMDREGKRTVHALAVGQVVSMLPTGYNPPADILERLKTLEELGYNPHVSDNFYLKSTLVKVEYAKELFAFNNQVKVFL